MEYCHFGHILYCFQNPLPEIEARSICQQLLEAVEVLHGLGIVHRDIKPQVQKLFAPFSLHILMHGYRMSWWHRRLQYGLSSQTLELADS